jgi:hypothetical protein
MALEAVVVTVSVIGTAAAPAVMVWLGGFRLHPGRIVAVPVPV